MSLPPEELSALAEQEDIDGLCALVSAALASAEDASELRTAIQGVLHGWMYDFHCGKGGDPSQFPYLKGLDALQALGQDDTFIDRGDYLSVCSDFFKDHADLPRARLFSEQSAAVFRQLIEENPHHAAACSRLIYVCEQFPAAEHAEAELKFAEALDWADRALGMPDAPYATVMHLLYRNVDFPALEEKMQLQREALFERCLREAEADPLFALRIADECQRLIPRVKAQLIESFERQFRRILDLAAACIYSQDGFDVVNAGHLFCKAGQRCESMQLLGVARSLFEMALAQPKAYRLIHVYIAETMEAQARLLEKSDDIDQARALRREIAQDYLNQWKHSAGDISFLTHALDYVGKPLATAGHAVSPALAREILAMAMAAEKVGQGHYWTPYRHLFLIHLFLGQPEWATWWLARGFQALNIVCEDQIKRLLPEAERNGSAEVIEFVRAMIAHLDLLIEKNVPFRRLPSCAMPVALVVRTPVRFPARQRSACRPHRSRTGAPGRKAD